MKQAIHACISILIVGMMACSNQTKSDQVKEGKFIPDSRVEAVIQQLNDSLGETHSFRVERGVRQVAQLWWEADGNEDDLSGFAYLVRGRSGSTGATVQHNGAKLRVIHGYFHKMNVELKEPLQLEGPEITPWM